MTANFDFAGLRDALDELDEIEVSRIRGNALERLTERLLTSIPGMEVTGRNVTTAQRDEELDLMLANTDHVNGLPPPFGTDLLVECKSSKHPLDSAGIRLLAEHAAERRLRWAVLVSLRGITGLKTDAVVAANQAVRSAFTRNGC